MQNACIQSHSLGFRTGGDEPLSDNKDGSGAVIPVDTDDRSESGTVVAIDDEGSALRAEKALKKKLRKRKEGLADLLKKIPGCKELAAHCKRNKDLSRKLFGTVCREARYTLLEEICQLKDLPEDDVIALMVEELYVAAMDPKSQLKRMLRHFEKLVGVAPLQFSVRKIQNAVQYPKFRRPLLYYLLEEKFADPNKVIEALEETPQEYGRRVCKLLEKLNISIEQLNISNWMKAKKYDSLIQSRVSDLLKREEVASTSTTE